MTLSSCDQLYAEIYHKHIREGIELLSILSIRVLRGGDDDSNAEELHAWYIAARRGTRGIREERESQLAERLQDSVRDTVMLFEGLFDQRPEWSAEHLTVRLVADFDIVARRRQAV